MKAASLRLENLIDYPSESTLFKEIDFLQPDYLDLFDLSAFSPLPISALLVTYNRCPFPKTALNPLAWTIESLLKQKNSGLTEIIVIDDGSTDYTPGTIAEISQQSSLPLIHHQNPKNIGSARSENLALEKAKEDLVFLIDDDCLLTPYTLFGLNYAYQELSKHSLLGTVSPPIFYRSTQPKIKPLAEISPLDLNQGVMKSFLDSFPSEISNSLSQTSYLSHRFLNEKLKVFAPLPLTNLWGVFLANKSSLLEAGGLPAYFTWKNSYSEFSELSLRLSEQGFSSFYLFDPKFHTIHLRFGFADGSSPCSKKIKDIPRNRPLSLEEKIYLSNQPALGSGNRISSEEWAYSKIISFHTLFGLRTAEGAAAWAKKTNQEFVRRNRTEFYFYPQQSIDDPLVRKKVWQSAITDSQKLIASLKKTPKLDMDSHFSEIAHFYRSIRTTDSEPILYLKEKIPANQNVVIADVGCGTGRYTLELLKQRENVSLFALDLNKHMLKQFEKHVREQNCLSQIQTIKSSAEVLPFPDCFLDCLLVFNAVHHFDLPGFIRESARTLKEGGYLFIYTRTPEQNGNSIWGKYFPHFTKKEDRLYSLAQMKETVERFPPLKLEADVHFIYPRESSLGKLLYQATNHHYSTFKLYHKNEFTQAIWEFQRNLLLYFEKPHQVKWSDQNILYQIKKLKS